jgi:hypothetical protein
MRTTSQKVRPDDNALGLQLGCPDLALRWVSDKNESCPRIDDIEAEDSRSGLSREDVDICQLRNGNISVIYLDVARVTAIRIKNVLDELGRGNIMNA